jgi:pyruvate/2-oxoglutarate/acetoin dehydrogenase E1 component
MLSTLKRWRSPAIISQSRHSARTVLIQRSATALALGAEVAARVTEAAWDDLAGPPLRIAAADTPVPFSPPLEEAIAPTTTGVVSAAAGLCEGQKEAR